MEIPGEIGAVCANERSYGSVRGVPGDRYPYRDRKVALHPTAHSKELTMTMFQRSMRPLRLASVAGLLVISLAPLARADVVYGNFDADMAFDTDPRHGWTINGFLGPNTG